MQNTAAGQIQIAWDRPEPPIDVQRAEIKADATGQAQETRDGAEAGKARDIVHSAVLAQRDQAREAFGIRRGYNDRAAVRYKYGIVVAEVCAGLNRECPTKAERSGTDG